MGEYVSFLVSILYEMTIVRTAVSVKRDLLPADVISYPMEPDSRKVLHKLLPEFVQWMGPIIEVEQIFDVTVVSEKPEEFPCLNT
jgi:hypothetical protein